MQCINCRSGFKIFPEEEVFCGFCGKRLTSAIIKQKDDQYLMYVDESQNYELEFEIKNTGLVEIDVSQPELIDQSGES